MDLEKDIEKARSKHHFFAWLVIGGLALEVIHTWNQPTSWCEKFLLLLADFLVFAGVFGETHYSGKASKLEDQEKGRLLKRIAELNARAKEAEEQTKQLDLQIEKLKLISLPRNLNRAQLRIICEISSTIKSLSIAYETDDETWRFAFKLGVAFEDCGTHVELYPRDSQIHSQGILIYNPNQNANEGGLGEPFSSIFNMGDLPSIYAIIGRIPTDISALPNVPMIIVGGKSTIFQGS